MNLVELAQRIKKLRRDRGMTLEQVASQAGLTRGWLSKVENFRVTPSVTALSSICDSLGISMSELFSGLEIKPPIVVVPNGQGRVITRDEDVSQLIYESLAQGRPSRKMDPFLLTVPPSDHRPPLSHAGEEFMHVLTGRVDLEYADAVHPLGPGDSAYFDGRGPHRLICRSSEAARVLIVYQGVDTADPTDAVADS